MLSAPPLYAGCRLFAVISRRAAIFCLRGRRLRHAIRRDCFEMPLRGRHYVHPITPSRRRLIFLR